MLFWYFLDLLFQSNKSLHKDSEKVRFTEMMRFKIRVVLFSILFAPFLIISISQAQEKSYTPVSAGSFLEFAQAKTNQVELVPRNAIFLTAFKWEIGEKEGSVTIVNHDKSPLEIIRIEKHGNHFTTRLITIEEGKRYQLSVKLNPDAPPGRAQDQITVITNNEKVMIPVFTFLKNRVYISQPIVYFGQISLKQLSANPDLLNFLTYSVFIYQHQGHDFQIKYQSSLPFISIKKTPQEGPGAVINIPRQGQIAVFELAVSPIIERLKPGKFEGTIRVLTNDKDFPELVIPVSGEVTEN